MSPRLYCVNVYLRHHKRVNTLLDGLGLTLLLVHQLPNRFLIILFLIEIVPVALIVGGAVVVVLIFAMPVVFLIFKR